MCFVVEWAWKVEKVTHNSKLSGFDVACAEACGEERDEDNLDAAVEPPGNGEEADDEGAEREQNGNGQSHNDAVGLEKRVSGI